MKRSVFALALMGFAWAASGQLVADVIDTPIPLSAPQIQADGLAQQIEYTSTAVLPAFTGVALQGIAAGDSLRGWIRFEAQGAWSEWMALYIVRSFTDAAFLAAYRGDAVHAASRFALRFETDKGSTVQIMQAGTFLDESAPPPAPDSQDAQSGAFVIYPPVLHDRDEWNAEPFRGTPVPLNQPDYEQMTLHHTAGFAAVTLTEGLEQVKRIQDFHQNGRGWSDIGYHYLMDQEGRLYQGRPYLNASVNFEDGPPLVRGAHVGGHNTGNIGVSLMGCYHPPEGSTCRNRMTSAAKDSLIVTFAYLSERYGMNPDVLKGHRDFSDTACPGDNNYALLASFRTLIEDLLVTGNAPLGRAALAATVDTIGVVALQWRFLADAGIETYAITREDREGTVVVLERASARDGEWVDATVQSPGPVTYLLTVRGSRSRVQTLSSAVVHVRAERNYLLAQSFPNPASGQATIRYFLQQPGIVSLHLFDAAGRLVLRLTDKYREEDTWHAVTVDTSTLSAGVYYFQLHLEGFAETIYQAAHPMVIVP